MTLTPQQIEQIVLANASALGLHIPAEYKAGVCTYFALAAGMADQVMGLELGVHDESGSVFLPAAPEGAPA